MTSQPFRVLLVVTGLDIGGAERQVTTLAIALSTRGHTVEVVSLLPFGPFAADLTAHGLTCHSLGMKRGVPDLRAVWRLRRVVRRFRPDVVHAHMIHANLLTRVSLWGSLRRPVVCTAHSTDEGGGWRTIAYRLTHQFAAINTNVSSAGALAFERRGASPRGGFRVVPNGLLIPPRQFSPSSATRSGFRWLCVARLAPEKALDVLLHAAAEKKTHGWSLTIVGNGPLLQQLQQLSLALGISEQVTWAGESREVDRFYAEADGLVLSSRIEGLPMVVLEAGARGLPVVATNVGSIEEVLSAGRGVVVPSGNPTALASAMDSVESMPLQNRTEMGTALAEYVRTRFSIDAVVRAWEELYCHAAVG